MGNEHILGINLTSSFSVSPCVKKAWLQILEVQVKQVLKIHQTILINYGEDILRLLIHFSPQIFSNVILYCLTPNIGIYTCARQTGIVVYPCYTNHIPRPGTKPWRFRLSVTVNQKRGQIFRV